MTSYVKGMIDQEDENRRINDMEQAIARAQEASQVMDGMARSLPVPDGQGGVVPVEVIPPQGDPNAVNLGFDPAQVINNAVANPVPEQQPIDPLMANIQATADAQAAEQAQAGGGGGLAGRSRQIAQQRQRNQAQAAAQPQPVAEQQPQFSGSLAQRSQQKAAWQRAQQEKAAQAVQAAAVGANEPAAVIDAAAAQQAAPDATEQVPQEQPQKTREEEAQAVQEARVEKKLVDVNPNAVAGIQEVQKAAKDNPEQGKAAQQHLTQTVETYKDQLKQERMSLTSAAEAFEKELKADPFYKDTRLWAGAIAVGLTLLMGADPRAALLGGIMAYNNEQGDIDATMDKLKVKDAADVAKYDKWIHEESQSESAFRRASENREDEQAFKSGEREATQGFTTGEREAGQDFTAGENQKDRDARKSTALDVLKKQLASRDYKSAQKTREELDSLDEHQFNIASRRQSVENMRETIRENKGATGFFDQQAAKVGRVFGSDDGVINAEINRFSKEEALQIAQDLKGAMSDRDIAFVEAQVPTGSSSVADWENWFSKVLKDLERVEAYDRRKGNKLRSRLSGQEGQQSSIPSGVKVTKRQ